jgi:nitrite reductase/ring-hydroxylating ferredoxin subunit
MKSAHGRQVPPEAATLTHVGPGTPMGELMRRYWQPVGLSDELKDLPQRVRILGEDLVLFRDRQGRPGLLELHCSHRGTSLEWGRIEERGLRCCYHGWLFDAEGLCLEMPCEPAGYAERRRLEHPAYPVLEYGGLVFAYLGPPDTGPLFPMYDIFDTRYRDDVVLRGLKPWGEASITNVRDCNWLQHYENVMDPYHLPILHFLISGPQFTGVLSGLQLPRFEFEETPLGMRHHVVQPLPNGNRLERYVEVVLPNVFLLPNLHEPGDRPIERDKPSEVTWVVPEDDTHVTAFCLVAWPLVDGEPDPHFRPRIETTTYDAEGNQIRPAALAERPYEDRQRRPDDKEAMEGQRPIAIHALEHLVSSDKGVMMLRQLLRRQLDALAAGRDPINVVRDPAQNDAIETHAWNTVTVGAPGLAPAAAEQ